MGLPPVTSAVFLNNNTDGQQHDKSALTHKIFQMESELYVEVIKIDNQLKKLDSYAQSTAHLTIHFRLCTALIPRELQLISNRNCYMLLTCYWHATCYWHVFLAGDMWARIIPEVAKLSLFNVVSPNSFNNRFSS
jgi:hypothetical protein